MLDALAARPSTYLVRACPRTLSSFSMIVCTPEGSWSSINGLRPHRRSIASSPVLASSSWTYTTKMLRAPAPAVLLADAASNAAGEVDTPSSSLTTSGSLPLNLDYSLVEDVDNLTAPEPQLPTAIVPVAALRHNLKAIALDCSNKVVLAQGRPF